MISFNIFSMMVKVLLFLTPIKLHLAYILPQSQNNSTPNTINLNNSLSKFVVNGSHPLLG